MSKKETVMSATQSTARPGAPPGVRLGSALAVIAVAQLMAVLDTTISTRRRSS
jgi:hypothetical protein